MNIRNPYLTDEYIATSIAAAKQPKFKRYSPSEYNPTFGTSIPRSPAIAPRLSQVAEVDDVAELMAVYDSMNGKPRVQGKVRSAYQDELDAYGSPQLRRFNDENMERKMKLQTNEINRTAYGNQRQTDIAGQYNLLGNIFGSYR
jgi:hypothetical protein